jgi:tetratricopeptide (TPR) repeat protein
MWHAIGLVTSGLSLAAFLAAVAIFAFKVQSDKKRSFLEALPESDRSGAVDKVLEFFAVEAETLPDRERFRLAIRQIDARAQRFRVGAWLVLGLAIISAGTSGFILKQAPGLPAACFDAYLRGRDQLQEGFPVEAVRSFQRAVDDCPQYSEAWRSLGSAKYKLGDNADALEAFQKAIALKPGDTDILFNLGATYLALGENEQAIATASKILERNQGDPSARYNRGVALQRLGRFEPMREDYERVIASEGSLSEAAAFNLAAEYSSRSQRCDSGDATQAIDLLNRSLSLANRFGHADVRLRRVLGLDAVENGEKLQALRLCDSFRELKARYSVAAR